MSAMQWLPQVVIGLGVVGVILYGVWFGPTAKQRRRMRSVAVTNAASTKDGELVRIVGVVESVGPDVLVAPFSGRQAGYYHAAAYESAGRNGWRVIVREERAVPFRVRDASGVVYVNLGAAPDRTGRNLNAYNDGQLAESLVDAERDYSESSGTFTDPSPSQREFLERHGVALQTTFLDINKTFKYTEQLFAVGETICLLGTAKHEPEIDGDGTIEPGPDYRGSAKRLRVVLVAPPGGRILASDHRRLKG